MSRINHKSKSESLATVICDLIVQNNMQKDSVLPSEGQLQRMFSLSRITIRRALDSLVKRGVIYKRKGSGTYVLSPERIFNNRRATLKSPDRWDISSRLSLGFVFIDTANEELNESLHFDTYIGASTAAREENCNLNLISIKAPMSKDEMSRIILDWDLDGLISSRPTKSLFQAVDELKIPMVVYGGEYSNKYDYIDDDNETGGVIVTKYLRFLGHEKIVFVDVPGYDSRYKRRRNGFIKAYELDRKPFPIDKIWIYDGPDSLNDRIIKERPTAIFAGGDSVACEIAVSLKGLGLRIPEDISIVGYDNRPSSKLVYPDLTTISCSRRELGIQTIKAIKDRIASPRSPIKKVFIVPSLIVRNSAAQL